MGAGAKPRFDKFPLQAMVNVYAWVGNMNESSARIEKVIGELYENPDDPDLWKELETEKARLKNRSIGLQNELNRLIASQNKGK